MQRPAPEEWKTVQRALRNRRAALPVDLECWARTSADMQEAAMTPVATGTGVLVGGALTQDATDTGFPTWGVCFHAVMLLWFLAILV